jgi:hypothetical protein
MSKSYEKPDVKSRSIQPGEIEAGSRFAQKRAVPRYPFTARAVIVEPIARLEFSSKTSDISAKGCYVERVDDLPVNTVIRIRIEAAAESFESWGRVAHVKAGLGSGISFFETRAEQQRILEKWVGAASEFLDRERV